MDDEITLEYEDRVLLRFTPAQADFIPGLESSVEYMRDTAIVNIIDNDCKFHFHLKLSPLPFSIQCWRSILKSLIISLKNVQGHIYHAR